MFITAHKYIIVPFLFSNTHTHACTHKHIFDKYCLLNKVLKEITVSKNKCSFNVGINLY